jgi:tetratricopeptide repeat protein 21B
MQSLERAKEAEDPLSMELDVKALLLLARVAKGSRDTERFIDMQMRARTLQGQLLSKTRGDAELGRAGREKAADICYTLAQEYDAIKNFDKAVVFYNEALKHDDVHTKSMLALAKLNLSKNETDQCQQLCVTLLRADPESEEASMMLAELMFRKEHYETAIYHFQQLLEKKPGHCVALSQLMHLLRRAGRLHEVPRYLRLAEKSDPRATHNPGLYFCKGLHARYSNNPHEALKNFNMARKDNEWGTQALYNMVEIYLNPDNETVWHDDGTEGKLADNGEAVKAAEKLLKEVRSSPLPLKHHILECYAMMASKQKGDVEAALGR